MPDLITAFSQFFERCAAFPQQLGVSFFDFLFGFFGFCTPVINPVVSQLVPIMGPVIEPLRFLACSALNACCIPMPGFCYLLSITALYPQLFGYINQLIYPLCYA